MDPETFWRNLAKKGGIKSWKSFKAHFAGLDPFSLDEFYFNYGYGVVDPLDFLWTTEWLCNYNKSWEQHASRWSTSHTTMEKAAINTLLELSPYFAEVGKLFLSFVFRIFHLDANS